MQFEISDGQTVSVWFNNPDANPNQISGSDTVVSWKWLLNSRDVTVALQPKNGENVNVAKLAERIMILVAKNSKRFASAQKRKGENQQAIDDAVKRVDELTQNLAELDSEINQLRENIEQFHAKKDKDGNEVLDEPTQSEEPVQNDKNMEQKYEYRPHGKDLTFVGQEFEHTPTGDTYTVWGVAKGNERWGVAILVATVNMGKKITTKELAQKVATAMQDEYGATQVEIRSDREFLSGGALSIKNAFGAGGLTQ